MQCRTHMKQRQTECPLNVLQSYSSLSKTATRITAKSFENFRRHFLKINFQYNVHFITLTATSVYGMRGTTNVLGMTALNSVSIATAVQSTREPPKCDKVLPNSDGSKIKEDNWPKTLSVLYHPEWQCQRDSFLPIWLYEMVKQYPNWVNQIFCVCSHCILPFTAMRTILSSRIMD